MKKATAKIISAVLAVAIVMCSIVTTFSVFADNAETYSVTYGSPAIPMFLNTKVDLKNMEFQFEQNGEFVTGKSVTWSVDADNENPAGIILDASAKTVAALSLGTYKLNAAYGGKDYKVFVMVNTQDDYNFYLENPGLTTTDFNADNWIIADPRTANGIQDQYFINEQYLKVDSVDNNQYAASDSGLFTGGTGRWTMNYGQNAVFYKSDILKYFADYTVEADVIPYNDELNKDCGNFGFMVRGNILYDAAAGEALLPECNTAMFLRLRNYGGLNITAKSGSNNIFMSSNDGSVVRLTTLHSYDSFTKDDALTSLTEKTSEFRIYPDKSVKRRISVTVDGVDIKYSIDGNTVFDSTSANGIGYLNFSCLYNEPDESKFTTGDYAYEEYKNSIESLGTGRGTVGIVSGRRVSLVSYFAVKLNVNSANDMPASVPFEIYAVNGNNPYIPMTAGYKVNTSEFLIQLGDSTYRGNEVAFTSADDGITVSGDEIIANKKGAYVLDAKLKSDETVTGTLYVIVKNPGDTEYVVYENDFRSLYESDGNGGYKARTYENDWQTSVFFNGKAESNKVANYFGDLYTEDLTGAVNYADKLEFNMGYAPFTTAAVRAAMTAKGESGAFGKNIFGYTLLQNDIVSSLSNYKITATFKMAPGSMGVVGLVGRVNNYDSDYNLSLNGAAVTGFGITASANYCSATGNQNIPGLYCITTSGNSNKRADSAAYPTATDSPWVRNMFIEGKQHPCETPIIREYTLEFNGGTATYSTPAVSDTATAASAETNGAVGFIIYEETRAWDGGNRTSVLDFKVTLTNVNDSALTLKRIDEVEDETYNDPYTEIDGSYDYSIDENGRLYGIAVAADKEFYGNKLTVPSSINGIEVAGLGDKAKSGGINYASSVTPLTDTTTNKYLSYIDFSNTNATYLNSELFYRPLKSYENLETVILPDSITTVESAGTFRNAASLRSFKAPAKMNIVPYAMFQNCFSLNKVELNDSLTLIDYYAFQNCTNLSEITIPGNVSDIRGAAFYNCASLSNVTLQNGVRVIDYQVFAGCVSLKTISIPESVTRIGNNNFPKLESIYIYSKDCSIESNAINSGAVIYGYTGSTAQAYAAANGNTFVALDEFTGTSATIAANTKFNVGSLLFTVGDNQVRGEEISWTANSSDADAYEFTDNYLFAYKTGEVTLTGEYNGASVTVNVTIAQSGSNSTVAVTKFADDGITVKPIADGKYVFTLSNTYVPGTFKLKENGVENNNVTIDETGHIYTVQVVRVSDMYAYASFAASENEVEASAYMLGATIRPENAENGVKAGIKFVSAVPQIKKNADGTVTLDTSDKYLSDGTAVNFTAVGALIIPEALTNGKKLKITDKDFDVTGSEMTFGKYKAVNLPISKYTTANEAYSQVSAVLQDIPADMLSTRITAVTYLKYIEKDTGKTGFIYTDEKTISYDEVMELAYPTFTTGHYEDIITGGAVNDLDNSTLTDAVSYNVNEDITFKYEVNGLYNVKYELYKDKPDENLYGDEARAAANSTLVKSGVITDRIFKITTQMKTAGTVRLRIYLLDVNGNAINMPGGDIKYYDTTVVADYSNIKEVMIEQNVLSYDDTAKIYPEMIDAFSAPVNNIKSAIDNDSNFTEYWNKITTNPQVNDKYENDLVYLNVVKVSATDVFVDFRLATDSVIGTTSTGSDNLFSDAKYAQQAEAVGQPAYNLRPSTGSLIIPINAADGSLGIKGEYQGYGNGNGNITYSAGNNIAVRMNSHGFENYKAISNPDYINTLNSVTPENGGVLYCIVGGDLENSTTDYKQLYQYGILKRDYVALQFAKMLPAYNTAGKNISVSGDSMGAWQSVSMAALDSDVSNAALKIVWMCSVGGNEYGYNSSNFMPSVSRASTHMLFSSVGAADYINKSGHTDLKVAIEGGLSDYTAPTQGLFALYNKLNCEKSIKMEQYKTHYNYGIDGKGSKNSYISYRSAAKQ